MPKHMNFVDAEADNLLKKNEAEKAAKEASNRSAALHRKLKKTAFNKYGKAQEAEYRKAKEEEDKAWAVYSKYAPKLSSESNK